MASKRQNVGGCTRKLPQQELRELLARADLSGPIPSASRVTRQTDLGDSHLMVLSEPVEALLATSDLLFPVSADGHLFGSIAGAHALSDIYAALGQPLFACVTLGGPKKLLVSNYASSALRGLKANIAQAGVVLSGGHTVESSDAFLNIAVTGRASTIYDPCPPNPGDRILLSKPLGTGLALAALKMDLVTEDDIRPEYEQMVITNRRAAHALLEELEAARGSVRAVTDVSGFGLLGALGFIGGKATVQLFSDDLPMVPGALDYVREQAWSGLADANLRDSAASMSFDPGVPDGIASVLVNDPQTSGGLVALVDPETAKRLTEKDGTTFTDIGMIYDVGENFGVRISRRKEA